MAWRHAWCNRMTRKLEWSEEKKRVMRETFEQRFKIIEMALMQGKVF